MDLKFLQNTTITLINTFVTLKSQNQNLKFVGLKLRKTKCEEQIEVIFNRISYVN